MADCVSNDELDSLIWHFLRDCEGHPTCSDNLIFAAGGSVRRIDSRMEAMRKAGRIRFWRNLSASPRIRNHGWEVLGCPGEGYLEDGQWDWREGCSDCLRRTNPDPDAGIVEPPLIVVFECELRIAPD